MLISNSGIMFRSNPLLPDDVIATMHGTMELAQLIISGRLKALPAKGSRGEAILTDLEASRRWHEARDGQNQSDVCTTSSRRWVSPWPEDADSESRMAYGRGLMDGYGTLPFLPSLYS
jgi:hypothetical protein